MRARCSGWAGVLIVSRILAWPGAALAQELALGDAAYARFENREARDHYLRAVEQDPQDVEALWKAARATVDVGRDIEERNEDLAEQRYRDAVHLARRAVAAEPSSADAHFVLAMSLGRLALVEGGKTRIRLSQEVRSEAERALELDPEHDGAHHVLGRWHYGIAKLSWLAKALAKVVYGGVPPGASVEQAVEHFAKAVAIDPDRPVHRLEYGRALAELERYSEARVQLQKCLDLPRVQWDDPANKKEAAELLEEIRGKKDDPR